MRKYTLEQQETSYPFLKAYSKRRKISMLCSTKAPLQKIIDYSQKNDAIIDLYCQIEPYINEPCIEAMYNNRKNKVARIKKRIENMMQSDKTVYFGTFTIEPKYYDESKLEKYCNYFKQHFWSDNNITEYVANVDFGETTERMHFHGVFTAVDPPTQWRYGFCLFKEVRKTEDDQNALAKYIMKLTNHALKHTGKQSRIMYSRAKRL